MSNSFIPPNLLRKCKVVVDITRKSRGFGNLPARIATKENMVTLACIPDMIDVLGAASSAFKLRLFSIFISVVLIIPSFFISKWFLLGLVVSFIIERRLAASERKFYMLVASVLLSVEILANDFAGWGLAYPNARFEALSILADDPQSPRTTWLDYYLPQRANLDKATTFQQFGPNIPE